MVQAESAAANEAVIAEETAGDVAHHDIAIFARLFALGVAEHLTETPQERAAAGDFYRAPRHFLAFRRCQDQRRIRGRVPGQRRRIDEMAHGVVRTAADAQEEPRRETRRRTFIGLRL